MTDAGSRTIAAEDLRQFVEQIFRAVDVPADEAHTVADSLVEANLVGHDSHGVVRVNDYVEQLAEGSLVTGVGIRTLVETDALLLGDAQSGFGQVQMGHLIDAVCPRAQRLGIACGVLRRCGHVGRLGEWVERTAHRGLASLVTVNDNGVLKCVAPPGGLEPRISTNPIAIGIPSAETPVVLDMSTSAVANGKITVAQLAGRLCPPGWLQDASGRPTCDPAERFADPPGSILPLGGDQGFKGFGLGLVLDMLVGGLSGGFCPPAPDGAFGDNNVLMLVWDPERFAGRQHFDEQVTQLLEFVRASPTRDAEHRIRLPGDRSRNTRAQRLCDGIPIDDGTWNPLARLAANLQVDGPQESRRSGC